MIPDLIQLGPLSISPFGPLLALAFVASYLELSAGFRRTDLGDSEDASAVLLAAGIGGIVGSKVYYAILYRDFSLLFERYGLVWYGGMILGAVAVAWTIRRRELPVGRTLDAAAVALALGYGIGRVGCFLVGDDYGTPTDAPWGVAFPHGLPGPTTAGFLRQEYGIAVPETIPASELVAVHPTQLYETAAAVAIWLVLRPRLGRWRPGRVFVSVVALLATERFFVEFLRAKDDRFLGGLTMAQGISVLIVVAVGIGWRLHGRRGVRE